MGVCVRFRPNYKFPEPKDCSVHWTNSPIPALHTRVQPHYRLKGDKGGMDKWGANPRTVW